MGFDFRKSLNQGPRLGELTFKFKLVGINIWRILRCKVRPLRRSERKGKFIKLLGQMQLNDEGFEKMKRFLLLNHNHKID